MKAKALLCVVSAAVGLTAGWFAKSATLPRYELREVTLWGGENPHRRLLRVNVDDGSYMIVYPKPAPTATPTGSAS